MVPPALMLPAARGLCFRGSAVDQRTLTVLQRSQRLTSRNRYQDLEVVEQVFSLRRRLHLFEIHVAHNASVLAQLAILRHEVVDLHLAQLGDDLVGVVAARRLDRFKVMSHLGAETGLGVGRRHAVRFRAMRHT